MDYLCKDCQTPLLVSDGNGKKCESCVCKTLETLAGKNDFAGRNVIPRKMVEPGCVCVACEAVIEELTFTLDNGMAFCAVCECLATKIIFKREPTEAQEGATTLPLAMFAHHPKKSEPFSRYANNPGKCKLCRTVPDDGVLCPDGACNHCRAALMLSVSQGLERMGRMAASSAFGGGASPSKTDKGTKGCLGSLAMLVGLALSIAFMAVIVETGLKLFQ